MYVVYDNKNRVMSMWACECDAAWYAQMWDGHYEFRSDIHAA